MSGAVLIWQCRGCGHVMFPARLGCPACGAETFDPVPVREGTITAHTRQRDGSLIVSVAVAGGVTLVARHAGADAAPGQRVRLEDRGGEHPAPWALPLGVAATSAARDEKKPAGQ